MRTITSFAIIAVLLTGCAVSGSSIDYKELRIAPDGFVVRIRNVGSLWFPPINNEECMDRAKLRAAEITGLSRPLLIFSERRLG